MSSGICGQQRPISACASVQSDQGLCFPQTVISHHRMFEWRANARRKLRACARCCKSAHFAHARYYLVNILILALSFHIINHIQSNLDSSNTDGSFTMANSNSFLRPYEVFPVAQENKYLGNFFYFIMKLFVVCTY